MISNKNRKPLTNPKYSKQMPPTVSRAPLKRVINEKLWRNLIVIFILFFGFLLLIGLLSGLHPPQPDSPVHNEYSPHQHHDFHHHEHNGQATIFIAMPSTNDPDCNASIISAFENAANPHLIYFGIHQQTNLDEYSDCLDISSLDCPSHPLCNLIWHIRISRVSNNLVFGPTWGRFMADKHYKNETFYLITDSHTFFRPNWDKLAIEMWQQTSNEYAIITHYPRGHGQMEQQLLIWNNRARASTGKAYHICGTVWESSINSMPRNANGCYVKINDLSKPIMTAFWGGGFAFSKSHFRDKVAFDPYTKWLFHGEEFHHSTRLWTAGYDFYSPQYDLVFHKYSNKASRGKMPESKDISSMRDSSEKRVNYLWGLLDIRTPGDDNKNKANLEEIDKYPLGNVRTMHQFWKFVGCDPIAKNITIFPKELYSKGGLERVPWNPPYDKDDPVQ